MFPWEQGGEGGTKADVSAIDVLEVADNGGGGFGIWCEQGWLIWFSIVLHAYSELYRWSENILQLSK